MDDATKPLEEATRDAPKTIAGATLGRYVLVRKIGEGGCGEVYVAYDPVLDRRLALKVLFGHGSSAWVREARMLARVSHPHVVTVHDAGIEDGKGFVATELIEGPDLAAWLAQQPERPDPRAMLALLIPIAEALEAAHAQGIVHGDVKPANILVAPEAARITDFGVARAIERNAKRDDASEHAPRIVGTPAYMAPEQLEGELGGERSDQYALCLTIWEAIFGQPAFDQTRSTAEATVDGPAGDDHASAPERGATPTRGTTPAGLVALAEARRVGPPVPPSSHVVPKSVVEALRRGLQPDPDDRHPSMSALAESLRILPGVSSRAWAVVGATVMAVASAGIFGAHWASERAQRCSGAEAALDPVWDRDARTGVVEALRSVQQPYAQTEAQRVAGTLDTYAAGWIALHREACEATSIRGEQSSAAMDLQMGCLHRRRNELDAAVAVLKDADATVLRNASRVVDGLVPTEVCRDLDRLQRDAPVPPDPDQVDAVEDIRAEIASAESLERAGRILQARDLAEKAVLRARATAYPPLLAEAQLRVGYEYLGTARGEDAKRSFQSALEIGLKDGPLLVGIEAASVLTYWAASTSENLEAAQAYGRVALSLVRKHEPGTALEAGVLTNLGVMDATAGHYEAALEHFTTAHDLLLDAFGPQSFRVFDMVDNIALVHMERRDMVKAEGGFRDSMQRRREILGPRHPSLILPLSNLAQVLRHLGRNDEATQRYQEALELTVATLGPEDPEVANIQNGLAMIATNRGDVEQALHYARKSLALRRKVHGPDNSIVADSLLTIGDLQFLEGSYEQALETFAEALRISQDALAPSHPQVAVAFQKVGLAHMGLEQWARAEHHFSEAIEAFGAAGVSPYTSAISLQQRGNARIQQGRMQEAVADLKEAARIQWAHEGPHGPDDALTYNLLGGALMDLGEQEEARDAFSRTLALAEEVELMPGDLAQAQAGLARIRHVDEPEAARQQMKQALQALTHAGPDYAEETDRARDWLRTH